MGKLGIIFLLINLLTIVSCFGQTVHLKGKWIAELASGSILLMDFKDNEVVTLGQIENPKGPLQINTEKGKWKLENTTLKLQFPDLNQELRIEKCYLDSIIMNSNKSDYFTLRKLVPIFPISQDSFINLEKELLGKQMIDPYNNSYLFLNGSKFKYTKSNLKNSQDKKWYVLDFEGTKFLILGEAEWFVARLLFIPQKRTDYGISFKYYYGGNIADFELSESLTKK